ncbi:MAG: hypothetical protein K6U74_02205 [Firmicutes bacterium]|nr:hypothetical protein [Bacillota bacterium]
MALRLHRFSPREEEILRRYLLETDGRDLKLSERQLFVIKQRLCFNKTFKEIGNLLGVSGERTRQICLKAERLLRRYRNQIIWHPKVHEEWVHRRIEKERKLYHARLKLESKGFNAMNIEELHLLGLIDTKTFSCLNRHNIHTVEELLTKSDEDLLCIRNLGIGTLNKIRKLLAEFGLSLKSDSGIDHKDYRRHRSKDSNSMFWPTVSFLNSLGILARKIVEEADWMSWLKPVDPETALKTYEELEAILKTRKELEELESNNHLSKLIDDMIKAIHAATLNIPKNAPKTGEKQRRISGIFPASFSPILGPNMEG